MIKYQIVFFDINSVKREALQTMQIQREDMGSNGLDSESVIMIDDRAYSLTSESFTICEPAQQTISFWLGVESNSPDNVDI